MYLWLHFAIKQEKSIARIMHFTFFMHTVTMQTLAWAGNKFIQKS